jgi:hypothetical protein
MAVDVSWGGARGGPAAAWERVLREVMVDG